MVACHISLLTFGGARGELCVKVEGVIRASHSRFERGVYLSPEEFLKDRKRHGSCQVIIIVIITGLGAASGGDSLASTSRIIAVFDIIAFLA